MLTDATSASIAFFILTLFTFLRCWERCILNSSFRPALCQRGTRRTKELLILHFGGGSHSHSHACVWKDMYRGTSSTDKSLLDVLSESRLSKTRRNYCYSNNRVLTIYLLSLCVGSFLRVKRGLICDHRFWRNNGVVDKTN